MFAYCFVIFILYYTFLESGVAVAADLSAREHHRSGLGDISRKPATGSWPAEGLLVGSSLLMSFLAGLMFGNMKDIIAHYAPILNKVNPAALISDAFYSISVYENPARYLENLLLLALITAALTGVSFIQLGRDRYDSL